MTTNFEAVKLLAQEAGIDTDGDKVGKPSQATRLVDLAQDVEFWHCPDMEPYATFVEGSHRENWPVRTKAFRQWLRRRFWNEYESAPNSQAVQDALGILEGKAVFDGVEHDVATRLGEFDGAVYLDLANDTWEAVKITALGWQVVQNPPVKFRRTKGMLPLPSPATGGSVRDLRQFLNLKRNADWVLLATWMMAAMSPRGPYPVLILHGEQGSAKSTLTELIRALFDPNTAPTRTLPRDERDLMIAANNGWCLAFDNLSSLKPWISDAICRLATGGGFSTRTLYENDGETLFHAQRPVILNGIEELATRGDLLDRAIILYLPEIPRDMRRRPNALRDDFDAMRPKILGALLDSLCFALNRLPDIELAEMPRMADFAVLGVAAEGGLGFESGTFMHAYSGSQDSVHSLILDASTLGQPVRDIAANSDWIGTAAELLSYLNDKVDDKVSRLRSWPKAPNSLTNMLRRLAPSFRAVGVDLDFWREPGGHRRRMVTISMGGGTTVPTVPHQSGPGTNMPAPVGDDGGDEVVRDRPETVPALIADRDGLDDRDGNGRTHSVGPDSRRRELI